MTTQQLLVDDDRRKQRTLSRHAATHSKSVDCHGDFGLREFGPGDQYPRRNFGPRPKYPVIMVRPRGFWSGADFAPVVQDSTRKILLTRVRVTTYNEFTSILCARLPEWAEERSLIPDSQFGFRQNRRATDCIFILNENAL